MPPLDGVRILDLSGPIGAYGTRLLADLGADVVKVEPPDGDPMRRRPPFRDGADPGPEASLLFAAYHLNKRGITLDVAHPDASGLLEELGRWADVVVLSPTNRAPVAGFDRDAGRLGWARSDAVVCALTPFGLTGPARDFRTTAFISYAMSGCAHRAGPAAGPPLMVPGQQQWDEASVHAAVAVVAALRVRDRAEEGQLIDLAVHEVGAAKDFLVERYDVEAMGAWGRAVHVGIPPTGRWECADGVLDIGAHQRHHWDAFLEMAGHPEELSEPALADAVLRRELHDGLAEVVAGVMAARTRAEAFSAGQRAGLPCSPLNTPAEFVADDQPRARGIFQLTEKEGVGAFAAPWRWVHSAPELISLRRPAPTLGQHNREVYGEELGHDEAELAAWRENGLV